MGSALYRAVFDAQTPRFRIHSYLLLVRIRCAFQWSSTAGSFGIDALLTLLSIIAVERQPPTSVIMLQLVRVGTRLPLHGQSLPRVQQSGSRRAGTTSLRCRAEEPNSSSTASEAPVRTPRTAGAGNRLPYSLICGLASVGVAETAYLTGVRRRTARLPPNPRTRPQCKARWPMGSLFRLVANPSARV